MSVTSTDGFFTIERTPGRVLLRVRHAPALLPGALTPRREGVRALRSFAREIAARLNEARAPRREERGRIWLSARAAALVPQPGER